MLAATSLLLALATGSDYRHRFPLPTPGSLDGWGVNIHSTDPKPGEMEKIRAAGFRWVRMDLMWSNIEREKGKYDFSAYRRLMAALKAQRMRPIFILDYGNDLYQKGSPRNPESRAAFARFVEAAVREFRGRGVLWEMWNEPNIFFWQPKPNVEEYIALANEVGKAIRRAAPEEWYVGPATSGFDWTFVQRCFDAGLLRYWDAVTVHPYRQEEPETVGSDWARLQQMVAEKAPKGKAVPTISGEWGYSETWAGMSAEKQGWYVPRQVLANAMADVPLSIYYDWKDDGADPKEPEHHFGTSKPDLTPKPAYASASVLSRELQGYGFHLRLADANPQHHLLVFRKGKDLRFVVWTTGPSGTARLPLQGTRGFSVRKPGSEMTYRAGADGAVVAIDGAPKVIVPDGSSPLLRKLAEVSRVPAFIDVQPGADLAKHFGAVSLFDGERRPVRLGDISAYREDPVEVEVQTIIRTSSGRAVVRQRSQAVPSHPIGAEAVPAFGAEDAKLIFRNPTGKPLAFRIRLGTSASETVVFHPGQREQILPVSGVPLTTEVFLDLGKTRLRKRIQRASLLREVEAKKTLAASGFAVVAEGDEKVRADVSGEVVPPDGSVRAAAVRVRYDFAVGWRYVCLKPTGSLAQPLNGKPKALGMYVYGDGKGDMLRMRFQDSTGQTFQPDAGPIDWKGWKWIRFRLDGKGAGRWGGANDGVIHHPIRIETIALVDSWGGRGGTGEAKFTGFTLYGQ